jgi:hypothetical protein
MADVFSSWDDICGAGMLEVKARLQWKKRWKGWFGRSNFEDLAETTRRKWLRQLWRWQRQPLATNTVRVHTWTPLVKQLEVRAYAM